MTSRLPADHPAHILGTPAENYAYAYLDVHVGSGRRVLDAPSPMRWHADIAVRRYSETPWKLPVATMVLTVVNPYSATRWTISTLKTRTATNSGRLFGLMGTLSGPTSSKRSHPMTGGHVLLIDTYEMQPDWRGTLLTPLVALRVLGVFAHRGLTTAALTAAPMSADLDRAERNRVAARVAAMWQQGGFTHLSRTERPWRCRLTAKACTARWLASLGQTPYCERSSTRDRPTSPSS